MQVFRKFLAGVVLFISSGVLAFAASPATVRGTVLNSAGNAVSGAQVTLTGSATQKVLSVFTGPEGAYSLSVPDAGSYTLAVTKEGFKGYSQTLHIASGESMNVDATLALGAMSQTVMVHGDEVQGATLQPSQQDVLESDQSIRVIDRKQMGLVGPVAGGPQIISTAPGALATGYGNTGATKYTITLNGLNQGWGGYGGYTGGGSLGITFDGVPVVDPATSLWPSATIPENGLIQNVNVTYGPGAPSDRWYTNVGGAVEFTPVQPTAKPQANVIATYGSYQQKDLVANASTGLIHGWSTIFSGGAGKGDDFRIAPDGFKNPSKDWAVLAKTVKTFQGSSLELGGYYAYGGGYRSQVIPIVANPYITVDGNPGSQRYSQPSSGFYSTLPYKSYNKYDNNEMGLIYGRENVRLDNTTSVQNLSWYMHIQRLHARYNDVYQNNSAANGNQEQDEFNNPHTDTIGDKLLLTKTLPWNTVSGGGYYIHALYNSRNNFYGPAYGGSKTTVNVGGKIRSSYFNQDDFSLFLQDDIQPVSILHITPGIRYAGFFTGFYNAVNQDFKLAPGAVLSTTCRYGNLGGIKGNVSVQDACPSAYENRSGVEPSVDIGLQARPWLNLYGGFQEALRAPAMGGGGGLFQAVDPVSYHLERGTYYQFGFKTHTEGAGFKNHMLFGANYYHQKFANQEIDTTLANGDTFDANGTSNYNGVNILFDDDPLQNLHLFANANIEAASYSTYVTGGIFSNGQATCNPPSGPIKGCLNYNGYPVSYVPTSTVNAGAFYTLHPTENLMIEPTASFQFIGSQHLFDNCAEVAGACTSPAPSKNVTMPSYATLNLGAKVPYKRFDATVMVLNVLNKGYNLYEYISAGSYFNTSSTAPAGSPYAYNYVTAYPGAPVTAYVSVAAHF
ncbi:MAG TPA: TonB-dependent receptor [Acidobacteriaceae bacterium]|nr:TonB-dependent receptor [Acidobacteriaceae bacterium]